MNRVDRAAHGPGWNEVILGAMLSLLLGIALGAVFLIFKPVITAKEPPKEPVPGAVYYVQGLRGDSAKARQVLAKGQTLMQGQSVTVTEDEVNSLVTAAVVPKAGDTSAGAANDLVSAGTPNVRIRNGVMQVGVPVTLKVLGFQHQVIAQARGGFEKEGNRFVFDPSEVYLGSCPVQRLPVVSGYVRNQLLASQHLPGELSAAWDRLTSVAVEGNTLVLAAR